jgi:WD40 repeat protein
MPTLPPFGRHSGVSDRQGNRYMGNQMKDERAHLQLFDLIARDWQLPSPATGVTFNRAASAVAFASADGTIHMSATADKESPNIRVRRALDTGRLTIAPRNKGFAPLKSADYAVGRSTPVVPCGAANFAFAKSNGRINTLTPGGIAVHLPAKAAGPINALALTPDGATLAYAFGRDIHLTPSDADRTVHLTAPHAVTDLVFSPDGQTLVAAHPEGIARWRIAAPDQPPVEIVLSGSPTGLLFNDDGAWLAVTLQSGGFCLLDTLRDITIPHGNFPAPVRSIVFGGPTRSVAASGAFRVAAWGLEDQRDIISGKAGLVLVNAVATCPTRNLVAVGYANGLLSLAEIGRPSEILLREDTGSGITAMAWSSDGSYFALAGADGSAALVELPDSMFKS